MPTQSTDPILALAAGIVAQAAKDAQKGDPTARDWLLSDQAAHICECLGIDTNIITCWADARAQRRRPGRPAKQKGN